MTPSSAPGPPATSSTPPNPFAHLTPREQQILQLLADGLPTATIAVRSGLAPKTVSNTLSSIFAKIGVTSRTEAAVLARRAGLGEPPRSPTEHPDPRRSRNP